MKRVFLIVMDSFGVGALPDANLFGDEGSNTLKACCSSGKFRAETLKKLGLFNIDGVDFISGVEDPMAAYCRLAERSAAKDTTSGHWEIAGVISHEPFDTFPHGFPQEIIDEFSAQTGRKVLCNAVYSGTEVILDYGEAHEKTGDLIVYTSADSVFQIAAHEEVVPVETLYKYCETARKILNNKYRVGRVIARPFIGRYPNYTRTPNRHDFSLKPFAPTVLDALKESGRSVIGIGKINDIFAGCGITETYKTVSNADGMNKTSSLLKNDFDGLCFVNLVDFDSVYGHRNDVDGYASAVSEFDLQLKEFIDGMREDDALIVTADHGCDPSTPSTDHSREYVPMLYYEKRMKSGVNLGTGSTFADIAATIAEIFGLPFPCEGTSFYKRIGLK